TVNGHADSASWGQGATASSIATALANSINGDTGAPVTATASGAVVSLTATLKGASTDYSLASSVSYDTSHFSSSSFLAGNSGSALTGGSDGANGTTVYDSGTVTLTVNGHPDSAPYGQSDSTTSLATALAAAINKDAAAPVTAGSSGATVTITAKQLGPIGDYAMSASSATNNANFTGSSFSASPSGGALSGGSNAPQTIYTTSLSYYPNNDIQSDNDSVNGNWTYTYDDFNRLGTAVATNGNGCSEVYDRFGNRWQQNAYNGSCLTQQM